MMNNKKEIDIDNELEKNYEKLQEEKLIDLNFVKPNKDCTQGCDNITDNNYVCFECEEIQVREKYPNAIYNSDCQWELKEQASKQKG